MKLSNALKALGYAAVDPTKDLETFEAANGLPVSATPDAKTQGALDAAVQLAQSGKSLFVAGQKDAVVAAAQKNLAKLGYDVGPADGVFDSQLADAIAKFKAAHPELGNLGRYIGAPVSNAIAAAASGNSPASPPSSAKSLVFSEISPNAWASLFPKLQSELASGRIAKGTSISVGSYGIDPKMAKDLDVLRQLGANVKYTPAFTLVRPKDVSGTDWAARRDGVGGDPKYAGAIPKLNDLGSDAEREAWGKELGRRFRDDLSAAAQNGHRVDGWMLDEIWSSASKDGAPAASLRAFEKGVLEGLSQGRDGTPMKGIAYLANLPALVKATQTPELKSFLSALNGATSQVVQEEYPVFSNGVAGAKANADNANAADQRLAALGPAGVALAKKLVAGMSPGSKQGALHGLFKEDGKGGWTNLGLTPSQVQQWRKAYMDERAKAGVAGFGEFGFIGDNANENVVDPVVGQVANEIARG